MYYLFSEVISGLSVLHKPVCRITLADLGEPLAYEIKKKVKYGPSNGFETIAF